MFFTNQYLHRTVGHTRSETLKQSSPSNPCILTMTLERNLGTHYHQEREERPLSLLRVFWRWRFGENRNYSLWVAGGFVLLVLSPRHKAEILVLIVFQCGAGCGIDVPRLCSSSRCEGWAVSAGMLGTLNCKFEHYKKAKGWDPRKWENEH